MLRKFKRRKKFEDIKSERVIVHVSQNEKKEFERRAAELGLPVATYIRQKCIYDVSNRLVKDYR